MFNVFWDIHNPPAEPPSGCADPQRWRSAFGLYYQHHKEDVGTGCACGEAWPCPLYRQALRLLLTAYLQAGMVKVPPLLGSSADVRSCCWCGYRIILHAQRWVHVIDGLLACDTLQRESLVYRTAEPWL